MPWIRPWPELRKGMGMEVAVRGHPDPNRGPSLVAEVLAGPENRMGKSLWHKGMERKGNQAEMPNETLAVSGSLWWLGT